MVLQQEQQQLLATRDGMQLQLGELQSKLQRLEQELCLSTALGSPTPVTARLAGVAAAAAAAGGSCVHAGAQQQQQPAASPARGMARALQHSTSAPTGSSVASVAAAAAAGGRRLRSSPASVGKACGAMGLAQQVSVALPAGSPLQAPLTALIAAIAAGAEERQALAAQGQMLLGLAVGTPATPPPAAGACLSGNPL